MKGKLIPWKKSRELPVKRDADSPFETLHREIDRLFDSFNWGLDWFNRRPVAVAGTEVSESDDEIVVKVELPGMDEKDIEVFLEDDMLVIRGERKEEKEDKKRNYYVSEISYGSFSRSIPLPAEVDSDKIKSKFKRGILTLTLPKTAEAISDRKRIPVNAG